MTPVFDVDEIDGATWPESDGDVVATVQDGNYTYETYESGKVFVYKGSTDNPPTYTITNGVCSCPASMYRSGSCKHLKAATPTDSENLSTPPDFYVEGETLEDSVSLDDLKDLL